MSVSDIYRASAVYKIDGVHEIVNVHHYTQQTVLLTDPMEVLANDLSDALQAAGDNLFSNRMKLEQVQVRGITDPTVGFDLVVDHTYPSTGELLPFTTAAIITWRTGFIGRSRRGRSYIGPLVEGASVGGVVTSAYRTALEAYADGTMQLITGGINRFQMIVWSPTLNAGLPVVSYTVQQIMGTVRRRRQGVGA